MTPRERTVLRAIVKALRRQGHEDMDAYAMSYGTPADKPMSVRARAATLIEELVEQDR